MGHELANAARASVLLAAIVVFMGDASPAQAAPAIRLGPGNEVPACVTPQRLAQFLKTHNPELPQHFASIAKLYKQHGEQWQVRWDYAFFQMAVETNFLQFRKASGRPGDVHVSQNNFAGLGATGGGVPGDRYPDVSTGVLAQIQHLVVYSGERVGSPAGHRTRLKQDDILRASTRITLRRPVTFQDLAGRWAADRAYGRTISAIARRYFDQYCATAEGRTERLAREVEKYPRQSERPQLVRQKQQVSAPKPALPSQAPVAERGPQPAIAEILDRSTPQGVAGVQGQAGQASEPRQSTQPTHTVSSQSRLAPSEANETRSGGEPAGRWAAPSLEPAVRD